ncbi:ABC transporter transmembrane domain-containing protein [Vagococcus sp. PNs007]|uniref:ABC transporter transmembrane domain-containing protein n=1 Tax=Vagococcus proximus TaxID=2991417 RepID=A0ABT5X2Z3_9ENTE|nr:ABC transporter transmembrane domain-containing protein [Vagococcus proximus]MDF0480297.1 ABC transporter transmembrane domain-containing protein [Vagococcus proximus]
MSIFKKLGWFFKQERKAYIIGVTSLILVSFLQIISPRVIGLVIDEISVGKLTIRRLIMWIGLLVIVGILQYLLRYIWRTNIWGSAAKLEKNMRRQLFHHFTEMDNQFYQKYRTGDLMAHATNDLTAIQNVAGAGILTFADSMVNGGVTILAMIFFVDWRLTLIALIPLPLLAFTSRKLGSKLHDAFKVQQEAFSSINDKAQESITGIKVIKTFGQEKEDIEEFDSKISDAIGKIKKVMRLDSLFDPLITLIIGLSYILTIIVGSRFIMSGDITIGQLITFIDYISMLIWPMFAIGRLFNVMEKGNASYDRVQELLAERSTIIEPADAIKAPAKGDLAINIERFSYDKSEHATLKDIAVHLSEGHTLGVVGKTGAGKTTLLKLIMREYDEYKGSITFGETDIRQYSFDSILNAVGYVPQDHFLFSMTIRDNIRFGEPRATQAQVEAAAELTAVHSDIEGMPEGYDTMVGERGVSLSGGQKQRLSIARAVITEPELLILDDALSAVDAKTEEKILRHLKEERQNKTTIIAAHRISSVMHAEEIIVIDEGAIIERGTHQELLALNGWYTKMYEQQQLESKIEGGSTDE